MGFTTDSNVFSSNVCTTREGKKKKTLTHPVQRYSRMLHICEQYFKKKYLFQTLQKHLKHIFELFHF